MADKTKIEWTDASWNPIDGCSKISAGCQFCYASNMAKRFWGDRKFSNVQFHKDRLEQPLKWKKPKRIFVSSMGDLFHENALFSRIVEVFKIIIRSPQHTFILLTKRPNIATEFYRYINQYKKIVTACDGLSLLHFWPPKNIWIGTTCENQKTADERSPILLDVPAAVRFISVEPMLSHIDISPWCNDIDWIICGTESGPKRRPAKTEWIRSLRDQCKNAGIPFFLKQMEVDGKIVKMPELDGKIWSEMPKQKR